MMRFQASERPTFAPRPRPMSIADEQRIRSATRHLVRRARSHDATADLQYVFDLLSYLCPEARAIVDDEAALTLADLIGGT